jgi:hypothetical protein
MSLIGGLRADDARLFRMFLIREFNNHLFIRAKSGTFTGEMDDQDMEMILERFQHVIRTTQRSELPRDAYAPKGHREGHSAVADALQTK